MTILTNVPIQQVYGDLLTTTNNGQGLSATLENVQDALGNSSPMQISTAHVNFATGSLQINSVTVNFNPTEANNFFASSETTINTPGNPNQVAFRDPCLVGINTDFPGYPLTIFNTTAATTNDKAAICLQSDATPAGAPAAGFGVLYVENGRLYFRSSVTGIVLLTP